MFLVLSLEDVELWWPNGYGNQKLYNLIVDIELLPGSNTTEGDKFRYNKTIGFRTVELVQDPIGTSLGEVDNLIKFITSNFACCNFYLSGACILRPPSFATVFPCVVSILHTVLR